MNNVDGEIKISLNTDTKQAKSAVSSLASSISNAFKSTSDSIDKASASTQSLELRIQKTTDKIQKLKQEQQALAKEQIPTEGYAQLTKELEKAENKLLSLLNKQERLEESGKAVPKTLANDIANANAQITRIENSMASMEAKGQAFTSGVDTTRFQQLGQQISYSEQELSILNSRFEESQNKGNKSATKISSSFKDGFKKVASVAGTVFSKIKGHFSKLSSNASNSFSSINKGISGGIKKLLKYTIGIRSLFILFRRIKSAAKEAFKSMAKDVPEVNQQISSMISSWKQVKNSLATMFQPLLNVIVPIFNTISKVVVNAMNTVAQFFATLTGQKYIYKAVKTNEDYAKSLDSSTKSKDKNTSSTKKNTKAQKDNNKELGVYDKLNVISKDDNKDSGGSGAGAGTGDSGTSTGPSFIKQAFNPDNAVSDFAKRLSDAFKKGDFKGIGTILGTKLRDALSKIPWTDIQTKAQKIGKKIGDFINGFISVPGLPEKLGTSLAQALNTFLIGIDKFVTTVKWDKVGAFIAKGINSAFSAKDKNGNTVVSNLATTLADIINAAVNAVSGFVTTVNWELLGSELMSGVNKFIKKINWKKMSATISKGISGLLNMISSGIQEFDPKVVTTAIKEFIKGIDWLSVISSITKLVLSSINLSIQTVLATWSAGADLIADFFDAIGLKPIADIFRNISKVLSDIGTNIDNVTASITKAISTLAKAKPEEVAKAFGAFFSDLGKKAKTVCGSVVKFFADAWTAIKKIFTLETVGKFFDSVWNKITSIFNGVARWFKNIFNLAWEGIKKIFSTSIVKTVFNNVYKAIIGPFGPVGNWFYNTFIQAWNKIKGVFSEKIVKRFFSSVWSNITGAFGNIAGWFSSEFSKAWKAVKDVFSKGGKIFNGIKDGILNGLATIINALIDGINKVIKIPFKGLNTAIEKVKKIEIAGFKPFDFLAPFTIPEIPKLQVPKLAEGAVIPPNRKFLAMLGDQTQGTNIETPLKTMVEAFNKALDARGGSNNSQSPIILQLDKRIIAEVVWDETNKRYKQIGGSYGIV